MNYLLKTIGNAKEALLKIDSTHVWADTEWVSPVRNCTICGFSILWYDSLQKWNVNLYSQNKFGVNEILYSCDA